MCICSSLVAILKAKLLAAVITMRVEIELVYRVLALIVAFDISASPQTYRRL